MNSSSPGSALTRLAKSAPLTWISCRASELSRFLHLSWLCSAGLALKKSRTVLGALHIQQCMTMLL